MTEYVWGTCVDLTPGYLCDGWSVAEVESIKPLKCRVRVYKREFLAVFDCPYLHKHTCDVWGTCCDISPLSSLFLDVSDPLQVGLRSDLKLNL